MQASTYLFTKAEFQRRIFLRDNQNYCLIQLFFGILVRLVEKRSSVIKCSKIFSLASWLLKCTHPTFVYLQQGRRNRGGWHTHTQTHAHTQPTSFLWRLLFYLFTALISSSILFPAALTLSKPLNLIFPLSNIPLI